MVWSVLVEMPGWTASAFDDLGVLADLIQAEQGVLAASVSGPTISIPRLSGTPWWLRLAAAWRGRRLSRGAATAYVSVQAGSLAEAKHAVVAAVSAALTRQGVHSIVTLQLVYDETGRLVEGDSES